MIEHLLRAFLSEPWIGRLDVSTLERRNASYVSEDRQNREGDTVWRVRLHGRERTPVYVLVEFQSRVDRYMAVRWLAYEGLFYQQLLKEAELGPGGQLPMVVLLVVYNGTPRWSAPRELAELIRVVEGASGTDVPRLRYRVIDTGRVPAEIGDGGNVAALVFRLEASRDREEISRAVRLLGEALRDPEDGALRRALLVWIRRVLLPGSEDEDLPETVGLEDFQVMLEKRVERWNRELREEGRLEALEKNRALLIRQLERRFGPVEAGLRTRIEKAGLDRVLGWTERLITAERLDQIFDRGRA